MFISFLANTFKEKGALRNNYIAISTLIISLQKKQTKRRNHNEFDNNGNPFKVIAENQLDSVNAVSADIKFELNNYKSKILDVNIEI